MINGIPFYTRIWKSGAEGLSSEAVTMGMAQEFVENHGIAVRWDEATCQNYGEIQENDTFYQVWLEVAGVAAWRLGHESANVWDVIEEYMNQP